MNSHQRFDRRGARTFRALLLGLAAVSILLIAPTHGSRLSVVSGSVELGRGEPPVWQSARSGDLLDPGDVVRTGVDGRAEIELGAGTVRLYPNSLLRMPLTAVGPADAEAVEMERGTSLFDVRRRSGEPFEVRTPEVVVSVKGTRFSIALAGSNASVAVFRGVVGVRSQALDAVHETLVREGFLATGSDTLEVMVHALDDPWQAWSSDTLPRVPTPELGTAPAPAKAAAEALGAARTAARREALEHAAQRHPEVERRVLDAQMRQERDQVDTVEIHTELDPVADRSDEKFERTLEKDFVEHWLNSDEINGTSDLTFEVTLIDGSDPGGAEQVRIDTSAGNAWTFDESRLRNVIAGEDVLPASLSDVLQTEGIDEMLFSEQMLTVLDD